MKRFFFTSFLAIAGTYGLRANAQEAGQPSFFSQPLAAPAHALELGITTAYNQGWGNFTDSISPLAATTGRKIQDYGGAGIALEGDIGYRFMPSLSAGVFAQGVEYNREIEPSGTNVRSLLAGVQATYFMSPYRRLNPWVNLGTAYRGYWIVPDFGGVTSHHGWEIARLQIGADMRTSKEISVSPYAGIGLDLWFNEKLPNQDSRSTDGTPVSFFVGAGLMGRFNIGGTYYGGQAAPVARR